MTALLLTLLVQIGAGIPFPAGEKLDVPGLGTRKCYDLQGAAALKAIEQERGLLIESLQTHEALLGVTEKQLGLVRGQVVTLGQDLLVLHSEVGTMTKRWEDENRLRHEAEVGASAWRWATLGAGVIGLVVGIGAGALFVVWFDGQAP